MLFLLTGLVSMTVADSQDRIEDITCLNNAVNMDNLPGVLKPLVDILDAQDICIGYSLATCGGMDDAHLYVNMTMGGQLVEEFDLVDYKDQPFCITNDDLPAWVKESSTLGSFAGLLGNCKICLQFAVEDLKPAYANICPSLYEDCSAMKKDLGPFAPLIPDAFKLDKIPLQDIPCQELGQQCDNFASCGDCTDQIGCGWCAKENKCMYHLFGGGDVVYCDACQADSDFFFGDGSCPGTTPNGRGGDSKLSGGGDGKGGIDGANGGGNDGPNVGLIIGLIAVALLVIALSLWLWRRNQRKSYRENPQASGFAQPMQLAEDEDIDLSEVPGQRGGTLDEVTLHSN